MDDPAPPALMTAAAPGISVIVPAHGIAALLPHALRSLQAQSCSRWEAIVVDDGDRSVATALIPFVGDPRIRLLQTDHGGPALARNRAAAAARADVLALLDADDVYHPDYIATMIATMERDSTLGFATCDAVYFGLPDRAGRRFSEFYRQSGEISLKSVLERRFNVLITCAIRRAAFEAVGGFEPALDRAEDFDLWLRLLAAGWSAIRIDRPLAEYRRRRHSLSTDHEAMLSAETRVYARIAERLAGHPEERAIALARKEECGIRHRRALGEKLIGTGRVREGIALLEAAGEASARWRLALPVIRCCPWLARPLMMMRPYLLARPN